MHIIIFNSSELSQVKFFLERVSQGLANKVDKEVYENDSTTFPNPDFVILPYWHPEIWLGLRNIHHDM